MLNTTGALKYQARKTKFQVPSTRWPTTTTRELIGLLDRIKEFLRTKVYPLETEFLQRPFRELAPTLSAKRDEVKAMGLWAPHLPKEHGGLGLSLSEFALVSEELGRTPIGHYLFNCQAPDIGNMEILLDHGTAEQKEKYFTPLARGEVRSCFSMTEPEHPGSDPTWMSTTATRDGDDYVINGHKWFTSSAEGASFAIVMAITNPAAPNRYKRASQIIVPIPTPGFQLVRNINVMGDEGSDYASHAEVRYENCRVPQSNLLGEEGEGFTIAQERLGPGRIHHCMRWIGICERAFDLMCGYAARRSCLRAWCSGAGKTYRSGSQRVALKSMRRVCLSCRQPARSICRVRHPCVRISR